MDIVKQSAFKDRAKDHSWYSSWVEKVGKANGKHYTPIQVKTGLGKTTVWGLNTEYHDRETLIIFPGARTSVLFWDADNALQALQQRFRIFMVETNGLPNLSDGSTPDIKGDGYGQWANEVFEQLGINEAVVAGASFGGLIAMKLGITNPEKVKAIFLLNPGCLQPFSLKWKNLYANILPIISPSERNVRKFLDTAVFSKPTHTLDSIWEQLIVDYEVFALNRYKDQTQKPYFMAGDLSKVKAPVHLLLGDKDLLFPFKKSEENARALVKNLASVKIFSNVGHGIETYKPAVSLIGQLV